MLPQLIITPNSERNSVGAHFLGEHLNFARKISQDLSPYYQNTLFFWAIRNDGAGAHFFTRLVVIDVISQEKTVSLL